LDLGFVIKPVIGSVLLLVELDLTDFWFALSVVFCAELSPFDWLKKMTDFERQILSTDK
jgi:hypothetical protein